MRCRTCRWDDGRDCSRCHEEPPVVLVIGDHGADRTAMQALMLRDASAAGPVFIAAPPEHVALLEQLLAPPPPDPALVALRRFNTLPPLVRHDMPRNRHERRKARRQGR